MPKENNNKKKAADFTLLLSVIILSIIGLIMVFSASMPHAIAKYNNGYYFLKKHARFLIIGFLGMFVCMNINYKYWSKLSILAFVGSIFLSALVVLTPLGVEHNGAYRWLNIFGFEFMPSDIVKVSSIMYFATFLSTKQKDIKSLQHGTIVGAVIVGISLIFIFKNDLGTTMIIFGTLAMMFFVGGLNMVHVFAVAPFLGFGFVYFIKNLTGFRKQRLVAFMDPFAYKQDSGWQVVQSLYAIGSGGIFGVGLGQSRQKFFYLSEAYNDFIFAIIAEELGLIGAIIVISLYLVLIYRGIKIAINIDDLFGKFLATGFTSLIAVQSLVHLAVVTSSIPTTGVTLPLISYGGTSLIIILCSMGILLNISRYSNLDRS